MFPGALILSDLLKEIFFFKKDLISFFVNIPGLKILILSDKSITVDSIPIFDFPPFKIIFTLFLNSL